MAKSPGELIWIEDELKGIDFIRKPLFGGFGYYAEGKIFLVLFESEKHENTYKNITTPYHLWNGVLFPVEKTEHPRILKNFPYLFSHAVLQKWLYLPLETEDFEEKVVHVIKKLKKEFSLWGTVPKQKKRSLSKEKKTDFKKTTKIKSEKIDMKRPQMFRDDAAPVYDPKNYSKISDFKNLGASAEKDFLKAGIKTPGQFIKLGWQGTLKKLVKINKKNAHSMYAYALIGALNNQDWFRLSDEQKKEAQDFCKKLRNQ